MLTSLVPISSGGGVGAGSGTGDGSRDDTGWRGMRPRGAGSSGAGSSGEGSSGEGTSGEGSSGDGLVGEGGCICRTDAALPACPSVNRSAASSCAVDMLGKRSLKRESLTFNDRSASTMLRKRSRVASEVSRADFAAAPSEPASCMRVRFGDRALDLCSSKVVATGGGVATFEVDCAIGPLLAFNKLSLLSRLNQSHAPSASKVRHPAAIPMLVAMAVSAELEVRLVAASGSPGGGDAGGRATGTVDGGGRGGGGRGLGE